MWISPYHGGLLVIGGVGSGKSTVLQTTVYGLIHQYTAEEIHIYGMDLAIRVCRHLVMASGWSEWYFRMIQSGSVAALVCWKVRMEQRKSKCEEELMSNTGSQSIRTSAGDSALVDDYWSFARGRRTGMKSRLSALQRRGYPAAFT